MGAKGAVAVMMEIIEEPGGSAYRSLLALAMDVCEEWILVKRDQLPLYADGARFLAKLNPFLIQVQKQDSWPGTTLIGHEADVYYFRCSPELAGLLAETSGSLYAWTQPWLPEDLCFFRNGKKWLVTVSHEKMGWIQPGSDGELEKVRGIPGLILGQEDG